MKQYYKIVHPGGTPISVALLSPAAPATARLIALLECEGFAVTAIGAAEARPIVRRVFESGRRRAKRGRL